MVCPAPTTTWSPTVAVPAVFERRVRDTGEVTVGGLGTLLGAGWFVWAKEPHRLTTDQRPLERSPRSRPPQGVQPARCVLPATVLRVVRP